MEEPTKGDGVRLALPFALADLVEGMAFGVVAAGAGLGVVAPVVMSATAFSGSAQFASVGVIADRGSVLAVLVAVIALNARYLAFGASIAPVLSRVRVRRALETQLLTDASWALAHRGERPSRAIMLGVGATEFVAWTAGTALGVAFGSLLGGYREAGLDAAVPAFFVCLLVERIGTRADGLRAAAGASIALALTPFAPAGVPLVAALVVALVLA